MKPWASRFFSTLVLAAWAMGACQVDDSLDTRLWPCSETSKENDCGTQNGRPMTCWEGFCMPSCDPNVPVKSEQRCLAAPDTTEGVLLDRCDPNGSHCPSTLNCLRTDLGIADSGLCVPMLVCDEDADCPGNVKTRCGSEVLRQMLGDDADKVFTNHLLCLKDDCNTSGCALDETCLTDHYALYGDMPDLCLANCDSRKQCPPDFACAQAGAPGAPLMCLPGVPGVRCTRDDDCLLGSCTDTGAGFSVCTITCQSDFDCSVFDHGTYFRCVAGSPDGDKHCIASSPFDGPDCTRDSDCPPETPVCFPDSPYERVSSKSECRLPCDENGRCPARGGLAHTCLGPEGGCYPGTFGMPCTDSSECLEPFTCEQVTEQVGRDIVKQNSSDPSHPSNAPLEICTLVCHDQMDATCDTPLSAPGGGYCASDDRCHVKAAVGSPCDRGEQCMSDNCENNTCTAQP